MSFGCDWLPIESSSISERPAVKRRGGVTARSEVRRGVTASALRKNPNIRKELRPVLEQALSHKMELLGVKVSDGRITVYCCCC